MKKIITRLVAIAALTGLALVGVSSSTTTASAMCTGSMCGYSQYYSYGYWDCGGMCVWMDCYDVYENSCTQNPNTGNCYMGTPGDFSTAICDRPGDCYAYTTCQPN
jgi:hypothetical protein